MRAKDPLAHVRSRLEDLDIKTIIPYVVEQTTHVVQSKRNTAKGLQALINGKYIVQDSYIDALVYATTPSDLENLESLSPLEADFDAAWPDATEYLPPAGKEPINRPAAAFAPDPARISIFEGYIFVFGDPTQFDNLQAPINNGQGKALFYQVEDGVSTAADIVQFMKNAAGRKGVGSDRDGPGGVVLVRFRSKGQYESWSIEVGNEVALMTDQRVIEQREFLDAILGTDASPLCRPLPSEEPVPSSRTEQRASRSEERVQPLSKSPAQSEPSQPAPARPKAPRVRTFVSKMKAFDDGFDMDSVPVYTPEESHTTSQWDLEPLAASQPSQHLNPVEEEAEVDVVSELLPGTRAMKRRRAEMSQHPGPSAITESEPIRKPKRPKLDVLEAARKHREEEEQQRQAQEDTYPAALTDLDVNQLRNLAIVEEMDLPARDPPAAVDSNSDRWDDRWNGRKNFKRFRRKGEPRHARHRVQTVIVPLEEVTRKDFGIGDHYWVSSDKTPDTSQPADRRSRRDPPREDPAASIPELASGSTSPPATGPDPTPTPAPAGRPPKRPRETRESDSDDEPRFRFRRKR